MIGLPGIKELIEKGDNISIDKIIQVSDVCRRFDVEFENGLGRNFCPPYLMLKLEKVYIGTAYGKKFKFNEHIADGFIESNSDVIKGLYNELVKVYNGKVRGFDKWKKQLNI
ncbi:MAG: hypothetical protein Q7J54_04070 [Candidatus Woesearchaeota archaeon]|nr:hypothetical protein [Candidatus Woesearchaeota archaeon]